MNITRQDLIEMICEKMQNESPATITDVVNKLFDVIIDELKQGNRIEFRNFGRFYIKEKKQRIRHNPKTLEKVELPPEKVPVFKPGRQLKKAVENTINQKNKNIVSKVLAEKFQAYNKK